MKLRLSIIFLFIISPLQAISLNEAVQKGIESDPEILAEAARYDSKFFSVSLAKGGYYPKLDLSAGIGSEEVDRDTTGGLHTNKEFTRTEATALLRQPLFEGFATSSDVSRAKADKETVAYELQELSANKALEIIKAYIDVLKAKKIISLSQTNLHTHNAILSVIEQRYRQGVSDKADLIQIKSRVANAKIDLYSAKNNALDAKAVYLKVVGIFPKDLETVFVEEVIIPSSLEEAIYKSKLDNPTILASNKSIEIAQSQKEASESGYYPHLFGDLSGNFKDDADGIEGTQETYQAMLRLEWNIFNGFKEKYQRQILQKGVLSTRKIAQETSRKLVLETTLSWNSHQLLTAQLQSLQEHVNYSKEVKSLYKEQYKVNKRSLIDVLNSEIEFFNASKDFISAQHENIIAKYRILNSTGSLNSSLGITLYR